LLGRPWQSNKREIFDGRNNTYTFENNGERHTLLPLKDEGAATNISNQILMMSEEEFLKQGKEDAEYTLLEKTETVVADLEVIDLTLENQILLSENENVMTNELFNEVLTIKSIDETKEFIAEENFTEEVVMEDNSEEIATSERQENEQEVILRDNKTVLCEKPQFDVENNMCKYCCEQVVEKEVFVDSKKEKGKNEKRT
jgi:hypothetical protein